MNRDAAYQELVRRRMAHQFPEGLLNPSQIDEGCFDANHLGPWSRWQGSLDAEVVIVGQDWGDERYFLSNEGLDNDQEPTCRNLIELMAAAGWKIGTPHMPMPQRLFFTNAVLGIRSRTGKSGMPPWRWVEDSLPFLRELLTIIRPRAVVSLGAAAGRACHAALSEQAGEGWTSCPSAMKAMHAVGPAHMPGKPAWFPFYHCGPLGMVNRRRELQRQDWEGLGRWICDQRTKSD